MTRTWKVIVSSTVILAACDAAFAQATPAAAKTVPDTMHVGGRVKEERVNVRQGPGPQYDRTMLVDKEAQVSITARAGNWLQVTLPNGGRGWIGLQFVEPAQPLVAVKPAAAPATTVTPVTTAIRPAAPPVKTTTVVQPAAAPKVAPPAAPAKKAADVEKDVLGALSGTKADVLGGAKDTPAASAGDTFRMLIVLLPVLGGIYLAVRGLKSIQQRTGTLPDFRKGIRGAILGGFNLNNARKTGGSSIRVVESIPLGSASIHLIEARGRVLLLGATGGSMSTLADLTGTGSTADAEDSDFRSILNNMSDDLVEDYDYGVQGGLGVVVGNLDDQIREAREAIARTAVRGRG
jgi:SH3-like domain-containing protein